MDSLEDKAFPTFSKQIQELTYFEFGSIEDHYKYRSNVIKAYPYGNYPIFDGYNHMQYQIQDSKGFSDMLNSIIENNELLKIAIYQIVILIEAKKIGLNNSYTSYLIN